MESISFKSFLIYCKKSIKKALIVFFISLILMIVLFSLLSNFINTYSVRFLLHWEGINESKYPDGSGFIYYDLINEENLKSTKNSSTKFENIDVDMMLENNDISISNTKNENSLNEYKISVKTSYFKNESIAKDFLITLVEHELIGHIYSKLDSLNLENYLLLIEDETEYYDIVNYIFKQQNYMEDYINSLMSNSNNNSLINIKMDLYSFFENYDYNLFLNEVINNNYVRNITTYRQKFTNKINSITKEINLNNLYIENLKSIGAVGDGSDSVSTLIAEYVIKNTYLNNELIYLNNVLNKALYDEEFDNKFNIYLEELNSLVNSVESKLRLSFKENIDFYYLDTSKISFQGISLIVNIFISFLLSIVLTFIYLFMKLAWRDNNEKFY